MCARLFSLLIALVLLSLSRDAHASRIEELCEVQGVRPNQLTGYGLIVGLRGTGDSGGARFTVQSTAAMLRRLGTQIDPDQIRTTNAAVVIVTALIPPFANPGTRIDVTVSSLGNARSLEGGTLVQTALFGADRQVYAVAQGPLMIGGFSAGGRTGSSARQNHTTVGRVPQGAIVERRVAAPELSTTTLDLSLESPSFVTAQRIVEAVDGAFGAGTARAVSPGTVRLTIPEAHAGNPVSFLAAVQEIDVRADAPARIVIDERTGTIVVGAGVRIREVAIAQGGLTVEVSESLAVSQPNQLATGTSEVVPETNITATAAEDVLHVVPNTTSLADVVAALNALGTTPRNLIAIFQALRTAGALDADIEVQ